MPSSRTLTQIYRFTGYIGVAISALVIPVLVYRISGSVFTAGLAMMAEWVPKLATYVFGGGLVQQASPRRAYVTIEALRVLSMALLMLAALRSDSVVLVGAAAALLQCCNAVSNLLFESAVSRWWPAEQRGEGHAQLLRLDLMAVVLMLPLLSWMPLPALVAVAMAAFAANCIGGLLIGHRVFDSAGQPRLSLPRLLGRTWHNLGAIAANRSLRGLSILSVAVAVPAGVVTAQLPVFLLPVNAALADDTVFLSTFGAIRALSAVMLISVVKKRLHAGRSRVRLLWTSLLLTASGMAGMLMAPNSIIYCTAIVVLGLGFYLYTIFARQRRQELIPDSDRPSFTGLLISMEAVSYLIGAGMLTIFFRHPQWIMLAAVVPMLGALVYARRCGALGSDAAVDSAAPTAGVANRYWSRVRWRVRYS